MFDAVSLAPRLLAACVLTATAACAQDPAVAPVAAPHCLPDGSGHLQATLRGAIDADIDWRDAQMSCEGGPRPDGQGLRVTVAGPLPGVQPDTPVQTIRFIFGIDPTHAAAGAGRAMPTNLTVILEGGGQIFATRGDDRCAVENLAREPLPASGAGARRERVQARGYCTSPATDMAGDARLLVSTFTFRALASQGDTP